MIHRNNRFSLPPRPCLRPVRIETLAVHAGHSTDAATGAVTPPIHLSTTFEREADGSYRAGYVYSRASNPTRRSLEDALAALEGGGGALTFASGSAATMTLLQTLRSGDHIIAPIDAYYGTTKLIRDVFGPWKLDATFVAMSEAEAVARAMRPTTRLVWVETPSNPLVAVSDIARIAEIAHSGSAICAVDNTWATPLGQRPLELGADVVMHATTKYLGGHSDVLGGALVFRSQDAWYEQSHAIQHAGGAVPSPFECWLVLRGLRTLPYRVRAQTEHARAIAEFLSAHPNVSATHWPGLKSHPGHAIAARQMQLFGGMLSFEVRGDAAAAMAVAGRTRIITRATSLGGPETLIEHRQSVEGPDTLAPAGLLRLSVGLEHPDDLIDDLSQALESP